MKLLILLAAVASAGRFPAPPSVPPEADAPGRARTVRVEAELWKCFDRPAVSEREGRQLPRVVCVAAVSLALVKQANGQYLFERGARDGSAPHASRVFVAGGVDKRRIEVSDQALYGRREGAGWRVWTVVERLVEDPGGDSSATTLEFALDAAGRPLPDSVRLYGEVACTGAVCQGAVAPSRVDYVLARSR